MKLWKWAPIRGYSTAEALKTIDVAMDRLERALVKPEPVTSPVNVTNVYTPDMSQAKLKVFQINRTVGTAFTIAKPIGYQPGAILVIDLINSSGGGLGAATWAAEYIFVSAYVAPGNGLRATFTFYCGSSALVEMAHEPPPAAGAGGEANTASNVGSAGVGIFDAKVAVDLQFRKLNPLSGRLTIALDAANKKVDLDVIESAILLQNLGGRATLAQLPQLSTLRLLGRDTAGAGDPEPIALTGGVELDGAHNLRTTAFTGDVTKAAGGTALTIAARAATYAKIQAMATARLLGRTTAAAGDIEELTVGLGLKLASGALTQDGFSLAAAADQASFVNAQTNITGLAFAIAANEIFNVDVTISCTLAVAATGVKFYFTFPASCTGEMHIQGNVSTIATWQSLYQAVLTVPGTFFILATVTGQYTIRATIRNAGTAGTIQLVGITGGATTTCVVKKGSQLNAVKVA